MPIYPLLHQYIYIYHNSSLHTPKALDYYTKILNLLFGQKSPNLSYNYTPLYQMHMPLLNVTQVSMPHVKKLLYLNSAPKSQVLQFSPPYKNFILEI